MKKLFVLLCAATAIAGAQAQTNTPRVDKRQQHQEQRIEQGVAAGSLSASEAARLEHQQTRIDNMENRAKADGDVTRRERAKLHAAQDGASRTIHRKKHNARQPG